jgi:hypothetical protein
MMVLDDILAAYTQAEGPLGGRPVRDSLIADIEAHQRRLGYYQNLQLLTVFLLTLLAIGALAFDLVKGENTRLLILGGAGLSVPALLAMLRRTIAEWSRTNLFLVLVKNSDEREARALLRKYAKPV